MLSPVRGATSDGSLEPHGLSHRLTAKIHAKDMPLLSTWAQTTRSDARKVRGTETTEDRYARVWENEMVIGSELARQAQVHSASLARVIAKHAASLNAVFQNLLKHCDHQREYITELEERVKSDAHQHSVTQRHQNKARKSLEAEVSEYHYKIAELESKLAAAEHMAALDESERRAMQDLVDEHIRGRGRTDGDDANDLRLTEQLDDLLEGMKRELEGPQKRQLKIMGDLCSFLGISTGIAADSSLQSQLVSPSPSPEREPAPRKEERGASPQRRERHSQRGTTYSSVSLENKIGEKLLRRRSAQHLGPPARDVGIQASIGHLRSFHFGDRGPDPAPADTQDMFVGDSAVSLCLRDLSAAGVGTRPSGTTDDATTTLPSKVDPQILPPHLRVRIQASHVKNRTWSRLHPAQLAESMARTLFDAASEVRTRKQLAMSLEGLPGLAGAACGGLVDFIIRYNLKEMNGVASLAQWGVVQLGMNCLDQYHRQFQAAPADSTSDPYQQRLLLFGRMCGLWVPMAERHVQFILLGLGQLLRLNKSLQSSDFSGARPGELTVTYRSMHLALEATISRMCSKARQSESEKSKHVGLVLELDAFHGLKGHPISIDECMRLFSIAHETLEQRFRALVRSAAEKTLQVLLHEMSVAEILRLSPGVDGDDGSSGIAGANAVDGATHTDPDVRPEAQMTLNVSMCDRRTKDADTWLDSRIFNLLPWHLVTHATAAVLMGGPPGSATQFLDLWSNAPESVQDMAIGVAETAELLIPSVGYWDQLKAADDGPVATAQRTATSLRPEGQRNFSIADVEEVLLHRSTAPGLDIETWVSAILDQGCGWEAGLAYEIRKSE